MEVDTVPENVQMELIEMQCSDLSIQGSSLTRRLGLSQQNLGISMTGTQVMVPNDFASVLFEIAAELISFHDMIIA